MLMGEETKIKETEAGIAPSQVMKLGVGALHSGSILASHLAALGSNPGSAEIFLFTA